MPDKDQKPPPLTPLSALAGAQTIGPPRVGVRYDLPTWGEIIGGRNPLMGLLELVLGNARAPSVAAADPYGIEAAAIGAGQPPIFMGTTQPLGKLYSRVDKAVAKVPAKGAHPNKVASILKGEASAEELAYRQVPEFLAEQGNKSVTPAALEAHLAQHPAPFPAVVTRGDAPADLLAARKAVEQRATTLRAAAFDDPKDWVGVSDLDRSNAHWWAMEAAGGDARALRKLQDIAVDPDHLETLLAFGRVRNESTGLARQIEQVPTTKYGSYQLPGGESYRETLYTLPVEMKKQGRYRVEVREPAPTPEGSSVRFADQNVSGTDVERLRQRYGPPYEVRFEEIETPTGGFTSGHFPDVPNPVAHTRSNVRTLPTGERGRFLEEVQSDWHQAGKQKGYARDTSAELATLASEWESVRRAALGAEGSERAAANARLGEITDQMNALHDLGGGVPDAPFKESWPDLTLKQQLLEAASDPETQWLGFTSGQTQAARYDLSKHIDRLEWHPNPSHPGGGGHLIANKGREVVMNESIATSAIGDYVGKEAATKLLEQPVRHGQHTLSGLDLQVGGEGMHKFYDELLPKRLAKIVKPFGGTVERAPVLGPEFPEPVTAGDRAAAAARRRNQVSEGNHEGWIVRLTPDMKQRILKEGLPLMTPLAALGGAAAASRQESR